MKYCGKTPAIAIEDALASRVEPLWSKAAPLKLTRSPRTVNGVLHCTTH
jgi:hypothetical protein